MPRQARLDVPGVVHHVMARVVSLAWCPRTARRSVPTEVPPGPRGAGGHGPPYGIAGTGRAVHADLCLPPPIALVGRSRRERRPPGRVPGRGPRTARRSVPTGIYPWPEARGPLGDRSLPGSTGSYSGPGADGPLGDRSLPSSPSQSGRRPRAALWNCRHRARRAPRSRANCLVGNAGSGYAKGLMMRSFLSMTI